MNHDSALLDDGRDRDVGRGGANLTPDVGVNVNTAVAERLDSHSRGCAVGCKDQERRPPVLPPRRPSLQQVRSGCFLRLST